MTTLKNGTKGAAVKPLQTALNQHGARPRLKVDGSFGDKTETALRQFQKKNKLKVDGVAGKKTLAFLGVGKQQLSWPHGAPHRIMALKTVSFAKEVRTFKMRRKGLALWKNPDSKKLQKQLEGTFAKAAKWHKVHLKGLEKLSETQTKFEKALKQNPANAQKLLNVANGIARNADKSGGILDMATLDYQRVGDQADTYLVRQAA